MLFSFLCSNLLGEGALDNTRDHIGVGEGQGLEVLGIGSGDISTSDTDNRGIQVVESLALHDLGADLGSDSVLGPASLNSDQTVGLLDGLDDGVNVQGADGTQVDNLGLADTLLLEEISSLKGEADRARVSNDGDIGTLLLDLGLADLNDEILGQGSLGHGEGNTVHELVLQNDNGVRVTDSSL